MLDIKVEEVKVSTSVVVMSLAGELDASNYLSVIQRAKQLYDEGMRNLLLDLESLTFMASSGLVAMHVMARILRGDEIPDLESGWNTLHAIAHDIETRSGTEPHYKLLNPQPRVQKTLDKTGFSTILQIFHDRDQALASF